MIELIVGLVGTVVFLGTLVCLADKYGLKDVSSIFLLLVWPYVFGLYLLAQWLTS